MSVLSRGATHDGASFGPSADERWIAQDEAHFADLFAEAARLLNAAAIAGVRAAGFDDLRPAHGTVAQHIGDEGIRITELAERAQLTKATVVYIVNDLERLGYVERTPDPRDGRAKIVRATERGREAQQAARRTMLRVQREWAQLVGPSEWTALVATLQRLRAGLEVSGT
jgi:DNA-binding MarR family transcriptional regulator